MGVQKEIVSRKEFLDYLNLKEQDYDVNSWIFNGIQVWPIIKVSLFFKLVDLERGDSQKPAKSSLKRTNPLGKSLSKIRSIGRYYGLKFGPKKKVDIFFCDSDSHRVWLKGKFINRYFLPISKQLRSHSKDLILMGITDELSNQNHLSTEENLLFINDYLDGARVVNKLNGKREIELGEEFDRFLEQVALDFPYLINKEKFKKNLFAKIEDIHLLSSIFEFLLEKFNPKLIFELCFYSKARFAMNVAAKKLGIPTIEIQHGGLGPEHICYSSWFSIPKNGYSLLPQYFWVWDSNSKDVIDQWIDSQDFHKVHVGGNPWIGYSTQMLKEFEFPADKHLIIFTLQDREVDAYMIDVIRETAENYEWWIRSHPRFPEVAKKLENKLDSLGLSGKVNFKQALEYPLPVIINRSSIHLSGSSGSILEAATLGVPSIILDEYGVNYYKNLIQSGLAFAATEPISSQLISLINSEAKSIEKRDRSMGSSNAIQDEALEELIFKAIEPEKLEK